MQGTLQRWKKSLTPKRLVVGSLLLLVATGISTTVGVALFKGAQPTLWSFSLVHFAGYLFFLLMPVEALLPLYVGLGHDPVTIFTLAMATATTALVINYAVGLLVRKEWVDDVIGFKRHSEYRGYLVKYGKYVILLFAATPLSSPILTLVAGALRFPPKVLAAYTIAGLALKYSLLVLLGTFF